MLLIIIAWFGRQVIIESSVEGLLIYELGVLIKKIMHNFVIIFIKRTSRVCLLDFNYFALLGASKVL